MAREPTRVGFLLAAVTQDGQVPCRFQDLADRLDDVCGGRVGVVSGNHDIISKLAECDNAVCIAPEGKPFRGHTQLTQGIEEAAGGVG